MGFLKRMFAAAAGAGLLLGFAAAPVAADSVNFNAVTISPHVDGFEWDYRVRVTEDNEVRPGDFFVIVDFGGYVTGSIFAPTGWDATIEGFTGTITSDTGNVTASSDNPGVTNLRFTRTGATLDAGLYDGFGAVSRFQSRTISEIVATNHSSILDLSQVNSSPAPVPIPLPLAAWAGLALFGLMAGHRVRKSRA